MGPGYTSIVVLPEGGWKARKITKKMPTARQSGALLRDKAVELARKLGVGRTRDFAEIGISRHYLCKLSAEGILARAGYGLYSVPKETM
jgi:hypothetical protein